MKLCQCLIGTVALRNICEDRDQCVHYVNDLPGLSNEAFSFLRSVESDTTKAAYRVVESEAILKLQNDLKSKLGEKFKVSQKGKSKPIRTGKFIKPLEPTVIENCLVGSYVPLLNSDYLTYTPISAEIYSNIDVTTSIYVFDTESGELIETMEFDFVVGINRIKFPPRCYASYDGIFVAYDASVIQSNKTESVRGLCGCKLPSCVTCCSTCEGCYKYPYTGNPEDAIVCAQDLEKSDCGIWIKYYTECSFVEWMCCYASELSGILRFGIGVQFFRDVQGQFGKANKLTLADTEKVSAIVDYFKDSYDEMIENFTSKIEGDCCCFECEEIIQVYKTLP